MTDSLLANDTPVDDKALERQRERQRRHRRDRVCTSEPLVHGSGAQN
jgi:hypothetical protein